MSAGKCHRVGEGTRPRDSGILQGESRWFLPSGPWRPASSQDHACSGPSLHALPTGPPSPPHPSPDPPYMPCPQAPASLLAGEESRTGAKTWRQLCFQQPNSFRVTVPYKKKLVSGKEEWYQCHETLYDSPQPTSPEISKGPIIFLSPSFVCVLKICVRKPRSCHKPRVSERAALFIQGRTPTGSHRAVVHLTLPQFLIRLPEMRRRGREANRDGSLDTWNTSFRSGTGMRQKQLF